MTKKVIYKHKGEEHGKIDEKRQKWGGILERFK
jgi:hypothetical protein